MLLFRHSAKSSIAQEERFTLNRLGDEAGAITNKNKVGLRAHEVGIVILTPKTVGEVAHPGV